MANYHLAQMPTKQKEHESGEAAKKTGAGKNDLGVFFSKSKLFPRCQTTAQQHLKKHGTPKWSWGCGEYIAHLILCPHGQLFWLINSVKDSSGPLLDMSCFATVELNMTSGSNGAFSDCSSGMFVSNCFPCVFQAVQARELQKNRQDHHKTWKNFSCARCGSSISGCWSGLGNSPTSRIWTTHAAQFSSPVETHGRRGKTAAWPAEKDPLHTWGQNNLFLIQNEWKASGQNAIKQQNISFHQLFQSHGFRWTRTAEPFRVLWTWVESIGTEQRGPRFFSCWNFALLLCQTTSRPLFQQDYKCWGPVHTRFLWPEPTHTSSFRLVRTPHTQHKLKDLSRETVAKRVFLLFGWNHVHTRKTSLWCTASVEKILPNSRILWFEVFGLWNGMRQIFLSSRLDTLTKLTLICWQWKCTK